MKLRELKDQSGKVATILFYCPACKMTHPFHVNRSEPNHNWEFNGDFDRPTFTPSLRLFKRDPNSGTACHLHVTDGQIQYCTDCPHEYAGRTIPLPEIPIDDPWHPDYQGAN